MSTLPFPIPDDVAEEHPLLLVTSAPGLGWWAECECGWIGWWAEYECGWIGRGYRTEAAAEASHEAHQRRQVGS